MTKTINLKIGMTCDGCSGAVTRILSKIQGVEKVDAQWETKKVEITCIESMDSAVLLAALEKWSASSGKSVELLAA